MQRKTLARQNYRQEKLRTTSEHNPIHIDVFTSERCLFCDDALDVVKSAARNLRSFKGPVRIVETDVAEKPDLVEKLDIVALPTILVGKSRLIGIPTPNDVERLVHSSLLNDAGH